MSFRTIATVAVLSVASVTALAGCSSTVGASSSQSPGAAGGSASAGAAATSGASSSDAKTYTASDLTSILTATQKKLGVNGKILDDAAVKAAVKKAGGAAGLSSILAGQGVTFSPAACSAKLTGALTVAAPTDSISSDLTFGTTTVAIASESGKALPSATFNDASGKIDDLLADCSDIKLTVKPSGSTTAVTVALKLAKSSATTDAEQTIALTETITLPSGAGTQQVRVITAKQGNLVISATGTEAGATSSASPSTAPSLEDTINTVVASSK